MTTISGVDCGRVETKEGDVFILANVGGSGPRAYAITDADGKILESSPASANYLTNPKVLQVTHADAAYLYYNLYQVTVNKNQTIDKMGDELMSIIGNDNSIMPKLSLSVFEKVGVIGDSYASGSIFGNDGNFSRRFNKSWIQQMARRNGFVGTNYSYGGLTTKTWLTNENGLAKLNSSAPEEMYILALSINDVSVGASYLGSMSDITSHSSSADYGDTFYGNYGRIIEAVRAKAPHAVIFIAQGIGTTDVWKSYRNAVKELATHYNLCLIDQMQASYSTDSIYLQMLGGHPSAFGYSAMALGFEALIVDYFEKHWSNFKDLFYEIDE